MLYICMYERINIIHMYVKEFFKKSVIPLAFFMNIDLPCFKFSRMLFLALVRSVSPVCGYLEKQINIKGLIFFFV